MYKADDYKKASTALQKAACDYKVVMNKPNVTVAQKEKAETALTEALKKE